jgi:hypothetical protein
MPESLVIELKDGTGGGGNPPSPGTGMRMPDMASMFAGIAPTMEDVRQQQTRSVQLAMENDQQRRLQVMREQKIRLEAQWLRLNQIGNASPLDMVKAQELDLMHKRVAIAEMELKTRTGWIEATVRAEREYTEARQKFARSIEEERQKQQRAAMEAAYKAEASMGRQAVVSVAPYLETQAAKHRWGGAGMSFIAQAAGGGMLGQTAAGALGGVAGAGPLLGIFAAAKEGIEKVSEEMRRSIEIAGKRSQAIAAIDPERAGQAFDDTIKQVAVLGPTIAELRKQISATSDAYMQTARQLAQYSGALASATAQAEIRGITGDIRRAQQLAPDLARFIDAQSKAQETQKDILARFAGQSARADAAIAEAWAMGLEKLDNILAILTAGASRKDKDDKRTGIDYTVFTQLSAVRNALQVPAVVPPRAP